MASGKIQERGGAVDNRGILRDCDSTAVQGGYIRIIGIYRRVLISGGYCSTNRNRINIIGRIPGDT